MVKYTLWGTTVNLDLSKKTFPTDDEIEKIDGLFVNCDHGFFDSSIGAKLHFRICSPTNGVTPKGICVFLHGIHGYSGLGCEIDGDIYKHPLLFNRLAEDGYIVYALDMQGHGFSEGKRFVIPYSDYKINRDDFASFASFVSKKENPSLPLFLMGESYGACLAIHTARLWMDSPKKRPSNFKGFCVLAPGEITNTFQFSQTN
jgi:alpha-beta hydrolase superfamily lysophospholipase